MLVGQVGHVTIDLIWKNIFKTKYIKKLKNKKKLTQCRKQIRMMEIFAEKFCLKLQGNIKGI